MRCTELPQRGCLWQSRCACSLVRCFYECSRNRIGSNAASFPRNGPVTAWFEEHQADLWDKQIEEDALAGRLDALAEQANWEFEAGHCQAL